MSPSIVLRCLSFCCLAAWLTALCGCRPDVSEESDGPLVVAVSIPPQAWLVEQIGGDRVEVISLLTPGDSPATYQPTDVQVSRVMQSRVYFRIGVPFEQGPWLRAIESSASAQIVDVRSGIPLREIAAHDHHGHDHDHAHDHGGDDPHIWLSPALLKQQAQTVADALAKLDGAHAEQYQANLAELCTQLDALDQELRELTAPHAGRAFYVFHPSWGYFADQYDLRQVAIEIGGKEPSDAELTELQTQARADGVRVVFVQPQISSQSASAVAQAIGGEVQTLDPLVRDVAEGLRHAAQKVVESF